MSTVQSPMEKKEDFPIESFKYLEGRLQSLRRRIMNRAAEIAKIESPSENPVFVVQTEHINKAIREISPVLMELKN